MWHVEMLEPKHLRKVMELVRSEWLGEDIGNLPIAAKVPVFDFTGLGPARAQSDNAPRCALCEHGTHGSWPATRY